MIRRDITKASLIANVNIFYGPPINFANHANRTSFKNLQNGKLTLECFPVTPGPPGVVMSGAPMPPFKPCEMLRLKGAPILV